MNPRLRKINITTGVSWVEAPDAGLSILCGCPADVVKHLMRHGLIVDAEANGVRYETGPNTILLSDVMLQNGVFCNLAEFPVLQMLYRQGMILPGHPNNTGEKPRLIGLRDQVEAQMRYIYRGNYGLISREEMIAAGTAPEMAEELMAMKLAFAFGSIRPPEELLDPVFLGQQPVTLKGGVVVRRTALNQFQFTFGEESVSVDLNLPPGETYAPPYMLGAHRMDRSYFSIIHTGEGDGWDANRPCMGSAIIFQGRVYLIDAGPNLEYSLTALGIGINEIEGVFHTHCHDDHFAGLTTLMRADKRVKYMATPLVRASVAKKLAALLGIEEESFADYFEVHDLAYDVWNDIEGLEVKPLVSPHPVETSVMLFRALWEGGHRTYAHWADIASRDVLDRMLATDGKPGISQAFHDKVMADYATPADIKKLDIGGGLIHGQAQDFRDDASQKIVLAHVARPLTLPEKEIGSGAPFGTEEVLIPGNQEYFWSNAFHILENYFPRTPRHEIKLLMNCPMFTCNPETILLRQNQPVESIFLLVTGTVEMIKAGAAVGGVLSAGAMVGEMAAILGEPAGKTYRASSFVQALMLPAGLYREFVRRNGLFTDVMAQAERRNFLRSTWLCAEALTETTLQRLANKTTSHMFHPGELVPARGAVSFLRSGSAELLLGGDVVEVIEPGGFWGEEAALFASPAIFRARPRESIKIYMMPPEVVREVPVMRWKLLESYKRRMYSGFAEMDKTDAKGLRWRDEYSVNVQRIDQHHRNLIIHANAVLEAIADGNDPDAVRAAMAALRDYARLHFEDEEELLERHGELGIKPHHHKHERLLEQLDEVGRLLESVSDERKGDVGTLLKEWVVGHIIADDRRAASLLNARGIY